MSHKKYYSYVHAHLIVLLLFLSSITMGDFFRWESVGLDIIRTMGLYISGGVYVVTFFLSMFFIFVSLAMPFYVRNKNKYYCCIFYLDNLMSAFFVYFSCVIVL